MVFCLLKKQPLFHNLTEAEEMIRSNITCVQKYQGMLKSLLKLSFSFLNHRTNVIGVFHFDDQPPRLYNNPENLQFGRQLEYLLDQPPRLGNDPENLQFGSLIGIFVNLIAMFTN